MSLLHQLLLLHQQIENDRTRPEENPFKEGMSVRYKGKEYENKKIFKESFYKNNQKEIDQHIRARTLIEKISGKKNLSENDEVSLPNIKFRELIQKIAKETNKIALIKRQAIS